MTDIVPWCAPVSLRWYPAGAHCDDPVAGDLFLVDHGTDLAWAIKTGETLAEKLWRDDLAGFTWLDHTALIREDIPDVFVVSEMALRGHRFTSLLDYKERLYCVAHFDVSNEMRKRVLDADVRLHNVDYGFIQYLPLIVNGLTHAALAASYGDAMICSTAVAWVSWNIYFTLDRQMNAAMPPDIAKIVGASRD